MKFKEKSERNQYGMKMHCRSAARTTANACTSHAGERKVATSPESVVTFVYTWGGRKEFEVRKDQEFPLATAEGNRTYKLIDMHPDKAVIVNTQNPGTSIEISFANP